MTSEPSGEISWSWWIGLALAAIAINVVYAIFFRRPEVPPENASFFDNNALVLVARMAHWRFVWGTTVCITGGDLLIGTAERPRSNFWASESAIVVPLADISAVRLARWYLRREPVVEVEYGTGASWEKIQIGVRDHQKLISLLAGRSASQTQI